MQVWQSGFSRKVGNMENGKEKHAVKWKLAADILCLAASYGILFLLPRETGVLFYIVFGISAFLFCIGFFRLKNLSDAAPRSGNELAAGVFYAVIGAVINITGLYIIHRDHGSARSIMIETLLLVEALVMYSIAGSACKTPDHEKLLSVVFKAAAVLLVLIGAVYVVREHFTQTPVIIAASLLIESICLWKMAKPTL